MGRGDGLRRSPARPNGDHVAPLASAPVAGVAQTGAQIRVSDGTFAHAPNENVQVESDTSLAELGLLASAALPARQAVRRFDGL
jgi:hypothetical protein